MSEDYYETIGRILNNSFSQNKDPFDAIKKNSTNLGQEADTHKTHAHQMKSQDDARLKFQKITIPKIAVPRYLIEDFLTLKLPPGSSLEECKAAWKALLKRYHPDLQSAQNTCNADVIIRINTAFRRIEQWFASCQN